MPIDAGHMSRMTLSEAAIRAHSSCMIPLRIRLVFKGRYHGYHGYGKARAGRHGGGAGLVHDARLGLCLSLGLVLARLST